MKLTEEDIKIKQVGTDSYYLQTTFNQTLKDTKQLKQQILENQEIVERLKELLERGHSEGGYYKELQSILKGDNNG